MSVWLMSRWSQLSGRPSPFDQDPSGIDPGGLGLAETALVIPLKETASLLKTVAATLVRSGRVRSDALSQSPVAHSDLEQKRGSKQRSRRMPSNLPNQTH